MGRAGCLGEGEGLGGTWAVGSGANSIAAGAGVLRRGAVVSRVVRRDGRRRRAVVARAAAVTAVGRAAVMAVGVGEGEGAAALVATAVRAGARSADFGRAAAARSGVVSRTTAAPPPATAAADAATAATLPAPVASTKAWILSAEEVARSCRKE